MISFSNRTFSFVCSSAYLWYFPPYSWIHKLYFCACLIFSCVLIPWSFEPKNDFKFLPIFFVLQLCIIRLKILTGFSLRSVGDHGWISGLFWSFKCRPHSTLFISLSVALINIVSLLANSMEVNNSNLAINHY